MIQIISILLDLVEFLVVMLICYKYLRMRNKKENEYYTDYVHNGLILRVYKPEFEYEAVGKVPIEKLLDRGTLSKFYDWCLIEK